MVGLSAGIHWLPQMVLCVEWVSGWAECWDLLGKSIDAKSKLEYLFAALLYSTRLVLRACDLALRCYKDITLSNNA
jgi:hypothetical protein